MFVKRKVQKTAGQQYILLNEDLKMRGRWVGNNVDLALLSESVEDFFRTRGFRTKRDELAEGHTISATPGHVRDACGETTVRILGKSSDFVIEFFSSERTRSNILFGFIATIIGGGNILLHGLKSQEALQKLEREFWVYVEDRIERLGVKIETGPHSKLNSA